MKLLAQLSLLILVISSVFSSLKKESEFMDVVSWVIVFILLYVAGSFSEMF